MQIKSDYGIENFNDCKTVKNRKNISPCKLHFFLSKTVFCLVSSLPKYVNIMPDALARHNFLVGLVVYETKLSKLERSATTHIGLRIWSFRSQILVVRYLDNICRYTGTVWYNIHQHGAFHILCGLSFLYRERYMQSYT